LDAQRHALRQAAQGISLGGDLRLSEMLDTDPTAMGERVRRIAARRSWPKGRRPHGVLAMVAKGIEGDTLVLAGARGGTVRSSSPSWSRPRTASSRSPPWRPTLSYRRLSRLLLELFGHGHQRGRAGRRIPPGQAAL